MKKGWILGLVAVAVAFAGGFYYGRASKSAMVVTSGTASDRMLTDPVAKPATSFPAVSRVLLATESQATRLLSIH